MAAPSSPKRPQYDPQVLLNSQPVIITVIDPASYKVQFENQTALTKFGDISAQTCYEKIVGGASPCAFCKMKEAVETGQITSSEVSLPNDEYLLVQWSKAETTDGRVHIIETITNITDTKRQHKQTELLNEKLEELNQELVFRNQQLQERSVRDGLTGLYNHSYFQESLTRMVAHAMRSGNPLSLLFLDLDDFKKINDAYGHSTGDQFLREMGWLLENHHSSGRVRFPGRTSDIPARYGGEEFAIILPDTPLEGAVILADLIRQRVTTLTLLPELAKLVPSDVSLSCSIGVACFPTHASTSEELIGAADQAVYAAKAAGKNCVLVYGSGTKVSTAPSSKKRR